MNTESEIEEIVNRKTRAWDTQDVDLLMTIFHHDMPSQKRLFSRAVADKSTSQSCSIT